MKKIYQVLFCFIFVFLVFSTFGAEKKGKKNIQQSVSAEGVEFLVSLNNFVFNSKISEPIFLNLLISNNSKNDIYLGKIFHGIELDVLEEYVNQCEKIIVKDGKRIPLSPKIGERLTNPIQMTLYGHQIKKQHQEQVEFTKIAPKEKYEKTICLSQLFDFSVASEYLISCKIKYRENNEESRNIEIKNLRIMVNE